MPSTRQKRTHRSELLPVRFMPEANNSPAIARPAVMERFVRAKERSVFLIHAPAGFGKTYVLAEWAKRMHRKGCAVAWINLRPSERDVGALLRVIADALRLARLTGVPQIARAEDTNRTSNAQAFGERLVASIGSQPRSVLLVLDDYHHAESEEVGTFLQMMFEQMPRNLMLALASRGPTRLSIARLLLEGRLERLDKTVLAFSRAETRAFFGNMLSPSELKAARALTEGWPAALRIAEICRPAWRAAKGDLGSLTIFLELFTEYASTEVLAGLDPRLVDFLMTTSVVEVIEPALADAITGTDDGVHLLDALASRHSLLHAVDTKRSAWSAPVLLRLVLRRKLERRGAQHVHASNARAAAWYEDQGRFVDAVRHYVAAGMPETAAAAVERAGPIGIVTIEGDDCGAAILRLIPSEQLGLSPRLALCRLFLDYKQGFMTEARREYEEISRRTAGFTRDREGGDNDRLSMEAAIVDLALQVYERSNVSVSFLRSIEQRLASIAQTNLSFVLTAHIILGMLFRHRGDLELATTAFMEGEKLNARVCSAWEAVWLRHHFGAVALARGQLHDARHQLQIGLKLRRRHFPRDLSFLALTRILLAEIDYEFDALSEAQSKIDEALYSAEHVEGWHEVYASVYETAAMLALHKEGAEGAEVLLGRADGIQKMSRSLKNFLPALRMRIAVLTGDFARARAIADQHRIAEIWSGPASHDELSWREWDLIGMTWCQMAVDAGDLQHAVEILDRIYQAVRLSGRLRSQVRVLVMRADVCRRRCEHRSSMQHFIQALEIGATQGYLRVFLDERETLRALLSLPGTTSGEVLPKHVTAFAARLARALQGDGARPIENGLLSSREREVMHALSLGHSNKLIARKLSLSEPTVKFHVQNIFRKLNVRRRASAVAEAHRRGFLS